MGPSSGSGCGGPEAEAAAADVFLTFNPGFTVPEYNWTDTLSLLARCAAVQL